MNNSQKSDAIRRNTIGNRNLNDSRDEIANNLLRERMADDVASKI